MGSIPACRKCPFRESTFVKADQSCLGVSWIGALSLLVINPRDDWNYLLTEGI